MDESIRDGAKRKLVAAVQSRWSKYHSAYLVSQIGLDFPKEVQVVAGGRKLLEVLRSDFSDDLTITRRGEGGGIVWAVAPSSADEFEASKRIPVGDRSGGVRWNSAVWTAFRTPLDPNKRRAIQQTDQSIWFTDLEAQEEPPADTVLELSPQDIAGPEDAVRDVSDRITSVLASQSLSMEQFTAGSSAPTRQPVANSGSSPKSLLDELLGCLSSAEARRVSMPLDIILKLHKQVLNR